MLFFRKPYAFTELGVAMLSQPFSTVSVPCG